MKLSPLEHIKPSVEFVLQQLARNYPHWKSVAEYDCPDPKYVFELLIHQLASINSCRLSFTKYDVFSLLKEPARLRQQRLYEYVVTTAQNHFDRLATR